MKTFEIQTVYIYQIFSFFKKPPYCAVERPLPGFDTAQWCSLEGLTLKLKLQYFGHLMRRVDSLEKTLMLRGIGGQEEKGTMEDEMAGWHHGLDAREFDELRELVMDREAWRAAVHGVVKNRTRLSD